MSDQETTRRETLKLAAAVAAFGTALGYRRTADAAGKTELKTELKHVELKLYDGGRLVHSCPIPQSALKQLKAEHKLEIKLFVNNKAGDTLGWDLKANKKL
ncbi:MAG TPA: hypothetical protein VGT02_00565 [Methylomirabilota bacterium]|jgi:hypothetical protein|nr:hypothetical protein [Methylomirabilota bacterium]